MIQRHAQRLLDVATANRDASKARLFFAMCTYGHDCSSPACCLGHYAVRRDLQHKFSLSAHGNLAGSDGVWRDYNSSDVLGHFGITHDESVNLFSGDGCGEAETAFQAAKYIENFLDNKGWTF